MLVVVVFKIVVRSLSSGEFFHEISLKARPGFAVQLVLVSCLGTRGQRHGASSPQPTEGVELRVVGQPL